MLSNTRSVQAPHIYLGDRGFLKRYGSPYSAREVESIVRQVLDGSGLGVASGDWPSALAVSRALGGRPANRHIYHSRFLVRIIERGTARRMSVAEVQRTPDRFYLSDGYRFEPDDEQISEDIRIVSQCLPGVVTVGGDWLDILITRNETELLEEILARMEAALPPATHQVLMSFRPSEAFLALLERRGGSGAAVPVNILGMQCRTSLDYLEAVRRRAPIYALHCLAGGRVPLLSALDYAFNHMQVRACIVGATQRRHIDALLSCEAIFSVETA
ncbi:hypothetical protein [Pseudomonas sp. LFM046]|uniref:hypothetical protein n=1 Tax=Pseudomonas sp. LFM046 TaxID=1608357 RepID=UPI0005CFC2D7|nr:hypothetical protein [Pseudomonas sp. LFM046]